MRAEDAFRESGSPVAGASAAAFPEPVVACDAPLDALERALEEAREALSRAAGIDVVSSSDGPKAVADLRARVARGAMEMPMARRMAFEPLIAAANRALAAKGDARKVARVVARDGAKVEGVQLVLLTQEERDALRRGGAATFAPWPRDFLLQISTLPLAIGFGVLGYLALKHEDVAFGVAAGLTYAVWHAARWWIRRRSVGLAIGPNAMR